MNGMDEVSLSGETLVGELKDGEVREYTDPPQRLRHAGVRLARAEVDNKEESVQCIQRALSTRTARARRWCCWTRRAALYCANVADQRHRRRAPGARGGGAAGAAQKRLTRSSSR